MTLVNMKLANKCPISSSKSPRMGYISFLKFCFKNWKSSLFVECIISLRKFQFIVIKQKFLLSSTNEAQTIDTKYFYSYLNIRHYFATYTAYFVSGLMEVLGGSQYLFLPVSIYTYANEAGYFL